MVMNERGKRAVVWIGFAVSQTICLFLPLGDRARSAADAASAFQLFVAVLGGVAFAEAVVMVVLLRRGAVQPIQEGRLDPTSTEGAARLFTVLAIAWTIASSVAMYGLVLRVLGTPTAHWGPFAVSGAILHVLARPWQGGFSRPATATDLARSGKPLR